MAGEKNRVAVCCNSEWATQAQKLAQKFNLTEASADDEDIDWLLRFDDGCLSLVDCANPKFKPLTIDFDKPVGQIARNDPLRRAIGKDVKVVLDATTGLGSDTIMFIHMGFKAIAVERSVVCAALLSDALKRCQNDKIRQNLNLIYADAKNVLDKQEANLFEVDVVYMDPMYPSRSKTSALARKECRMLRGVVGNDSDANELLSCARQHVNRVVVKRPPEAPPIQKNPIASYNGKLVRFDVYRGMNP